MSAVDSRAHVEAALRRIETGIAALDQLQDPRARQTAREVVEAVLEIHGLALAKLAAGLSAGQESLDLLGRLAASEPVRAVLLLHGLHPDDPETRIRQAVEALRPRLAPLGARVTLSGVADGVVRLHLHAPGAPDAQVDMLRREVEQAVSDAAPDIEEVLVTGEAGGAAPLALAS